MKSNWPVRDVVRKNNQTQLAVLHAVSEGKEMKGQPQLGSEQFTTVSPRMGNNMKAQMVGDLHR